MAQPTRPHHPNPMALPQPLPLPEREPEAGRLKDLQALTRSNSALRCLLSLHCRRLAVQPYKKLCEREAALELSERYDRLIEAVKLQQIDLQLERKKSELRRSRQFYADVAKLVLFFAGSMAIVTIFQPDFLAFLRDYVYCQVCKLGYTIR